MVNNEISRDVLQGVEGRLFDLLPGAMTPDQWAEFLVIPVEGAAAEGDFGLAHKLVEAGAFRHLVHGAAGDDAHGGLNNESRRNLLRGTESRLVDLISKVTTSDQWVRFLAIPIQGAAAEGDIGLVDKLVQARGGLGFAGGAWRALHGATLGGHGELVTNLLERGASLEAKDATGTTPLHVAAEHGNLEMAKLLLLKGADKDALTNNGWSPLRLAVYHARVAVAKALLAAGVDIKTKDTRGDTPLHHAAEYGQLEVVRLLLLKGADKNASGYDGWTPLHVAVYHDRAAVVGALLAAGVDTRRRFSEEKLSAIHLAAENGHLGVLKVMIQHGVDLSFPASRGRTALCLAAHVNEAEAIEVLIEAGSSVEAEDINGARPLHAAAATLSLGAAVVLLRHGAQVNSRIPMYPLTALHLAAMNAGRQGAAEMVDVLLRSGADETVTNEDGFTAAERAGDWVDEEDRAAGEIDRVRKLLRDAPADRAWRRRGLFVLCRAHPDRVQVQLAQKKHNQTRSSMASRTRSGVKLARAAAAGGNRAGGGVVLNSRNVDEWTVVAATVLGLEEEGLFRAIVGYL